MLLLLFIVIVVGLAVATSIASEYLSKIWVFDSEVFQVASRRVAGETKRVNDLKAKGGTRNETRLREARRDLKARQQELTSLTVRAQFITIAISVVSFWVVGSLFDGVVVGRLPFTPIDWFAPMTHRRLPGEDLTDTSYLFFFAMANMAIRPLVPKLVGSERPAVEMPGLFSVASQMAGED